MVISVVSMRTPRKTIELLKKMTIVDFLMCDIKQSILSE